MTARRQEIVPSSVVRTGLVYVYDPDSGLSQGLCLGACLLCDSARGFIVLRCMEFDGYAAGGVPRAGVTKQWLLLPGASMNRAEPARRCFGLPKSITFRSDLPIFRRGWTAARMR